MMKREKIFGALIFISIIISIVYFETKKRLRQQLSQRYVVGEVTRFSKSTSGGYYINYKYKIDEKTYSNTIAIGYNNGIKKGDEFIVSVPEGTEGNGLIMLDCVVTKDSLNPPKEGWKEIPIKCR